MKNIVRRTLHKRILTFLLSALILASTASVRVSGALAASATPAPEDAAEANAGLLLLGAANRQGSPDSTAAYAAEMLRYDAGMICETSHSGPKNRTERLDDAFSAAGRAAKAAFAVDWTAFSGSLKSFEPNVYDSYAQNAASFTALAEQLNALLQSASAAAASTVSRELRAQNVSLNASGRPEIALDWRAAAALYYAYGAETGDVLSKAVSPLKKGDPFSGVTLTWADDTFDQIASYGTREQFFEARFALAYLKTVYDDAGAVIPLESAVYPEGYLETVTHPLPGGVIKNGWYDPRSHRTRLHMGTDILGKARTHILSATDGTVLYIGFMPVPGNFVIIRDPYGYEYHYYHMFELSTYVTEGQSVKQGDVIGRVGSTGNSAAYHLHVSIVAPDGRYVNPYDLFVQAGLEPIQTEKP